MRSAYLFFRLNFSLDDESKLQANTQPCYAESLGLLFYVFFYVSFMEGQLPNGIGWADYHAYRIFNAVEYLRVNGY